MNNLSFKIVSMIFFRYSFIPDSKIKLLLKDEGLGDSTLIQNQ